MRQALDEWDSADIHRIACKLLKRTNAALTQNHIAITLLKNISRRQQPLFNRGRHTALKQHRFLYATHLIEQHIVLHIACPDLQDIGIFANHGDIRWGHYLSDYCKTELLMGFGE